MDFEMIVGLETHVELSTKTKIFCSCSASFGKEPNSACCPVCTGMPGSLPGLNEEVVNFALKAGLALNCNISEESDFDRKNYFYPDLPKSYQITQKRNPLCRDGYMVLPGGRKINIERIHIEEDAGKTVRTDDGILIDYNRSGVPLIEIVTKPDFKSSAEVKEYLVSLCDTMKTLEISDCRMQEGSLRCDVNISVRRAGGEAGEKTEIKNINSFSFAVKAIEAEYLRQVELIKSGGRVESATLRFDEKTGKTEIMRKKESAGDYRYFPEPDLGKILLKKETIDKIRKDLPELPLAKRERYIKEMDLRKEDAEKISGYPRLSFYFDEMVKESGNVKNSLSLLMGPVFSYLNTEDEKEKAILPKSAKEIGEAIRKAACKNVPAALMKTIVSQMLEEKKSFDEVYERINAGAGKALSLDEIVKKAVGENPKAFLDYKGGKEKAIASLIGAVMKETRGMADAKVCRDIIDKMKE